MAEITLLGQFGCTLHDGLHCLQALIAPKLMKQEQPFARIHWITEQTRIADSFTCYGLNQIGWETILLKLRHHPLSQ